MPQGSSPTDRRPVRCAGADWTRNRWPAAPPLPRLLLGFHHSLAPTLKRRRLVHCCSGRRESACPCSCRPRTGHSASGHAVSPASPGGGRRSGSRSSQRPDALGLGGPRLAGPALPVRRGPRCPAGLAQAGAQPLRPLAAPVHPRRRRARAAQRYLRKAPRTPAALGLGLLASSSRDTVGSFIVRRRLTLVRGRAQACIRAPHRPYETSRRQKWLREPVLLLLVCCGSGLF